MIGWARSVALLAGRILIAGVFLYETTVLIRTGPGVGYRYVESAGLPGWLWWFALALNGVGGTMIAVGLFTRWVAAGFAVFCGLAAVFFHNRFEVSTEALQFGKDMGLAGGFLFLIVTGAGALSLDALVRRRLGLD